MPNYSLVIGSKFRPISYQEMLAPVLQQTQAQQQLEESYAALDAEASKWKTVAMSESNPEVASIYMKYSDDLKKNASMLAMQGLTSSARRQMFNLNSRYQSEIAPIESAYKQMMEERKAQRDKGNDFVHSYDAMSRSLDEYYNNPGTTYQSLDLSKPYTVAGTEMGKLTELLNEVAVNDKFTEGTSSILERYSLSKEDALQMKYAMQTGDWDYVRKNSKFADIIKSIANDVYNRYKVDWDEGSEEANRKLKDVIREAVVYGIGKDKIQITQNKEGGSGSGSGSKSPKPENDPKIRDYYLLDKNTEDYAQKKKVIDGLKRYDAYGRPYRNVGVFGVKGDADFMKAYEEYSKVMSDTQQTGAEGAAHSFVSSGNVYEAVYGDDNEKARKERMKKIDAIKNKYGVTEFLTPEQYELLNELGYTNEDLSDNYKIDQFMNKAATMSMVSSFNDHDYDALESLLNSRFKEADANDQFEGRVYKVDKYLKQGEGVKKFNKLGLYDKEKGGKDKDKGSKITNVEFTLRQPKKLFITIDGQRYSINIDELGLAATTAVQQGMAFQKQYNWTDAETQRWITSQLEKQAQYSNPNYPTSSSDRN